jgi:hypothetical protein
MRGLLLLDHSDLDRISWRDPERASCQMRGALKDSGRGGRV